MKKLLLSFSFLIFYLNCFSQETFIGKTIEEIYSINTSYRCYDNFKIANKKTLHVIIDESTVDIYIFNDNGICIEYDRVISNISFEKATALLRNNYIKRNSDLFESYDSLYSVQIQQIADASFKIRFTKKIF